MANRIIAITPAGEVVTLLSDPAGRIMRNPTNITFGGADLRDLYIGSVSSDYVLHTRSPVPGLPLAHLQ
jgi:gluconolactonase